MLSKIKSFLKDSAIYSISNAAYKGMGVITLPIYSKYLTLSQFGIFVILDPIITILAELLTAGQTNSILYFAKATETEQKRKRVFFTITVLVASLNLLFILLAHVWGNGVLQAIDQSGDVTGYLLFIIYISVFRSVNNLFLNKLRADENSIAFTIITLIKIASFVLAIIVLVAFYKFGVSGIMYAYLISELLIFIILAIKMFSHFQFEFHSGIASESLKFGFPLIFSAVGIMLLNLSDRFLLNHFIDKASVGLYDFGYRIAGILNMFLIMPFNLTLMPSVYNVYETPGYERYYSKLMTYLCFITVWAGLAISLMSEELVRLFALNSDYNNAFIVVPIIILAYIFSATRNVASIGLLVKKKTSYIALLTLSMAILNILLNIYLIPVYGLIAAAYTTLFSYFIFHIITELISRKQLDIKYETGKLVMLFALAIILYLTAINLLSGVSLFSFVVKILLVGIFPLLLKPLKFYEEIEIATLKKIFKNIANYSEVKRMIYNLLLQRRNDEK
jgi:O-antigen/teichoic acid export membrane protein